MKHRQFAVMAALALLSGAVAPAVAGGQESATGAAASKPKHDQRGGEDRRQSRQKWWMDAGDRAQLGIDDVQSARIESVWQSTRRAQFERWREHQKLEPLVEQLIREGTADPAFVAQQVERLHTLKSEMNATRIVTLYRMLQELTPEQREKLRRKQEREEAARRRSSEPSRR